ncbi:MAG: membrane protein insertase YidC, partial [Geminicoccaceae bacterium]
MDQKRLFLAIAISVAILLGFQLLVKPYLPQPPAAPQHVVTGPSQPGAQPGAQPARTAATPLEGSPGQGAPPAAGQPGAVPKEVPRLKISAPKLQGSFSLLGARLDDLVLTEYRETLAPNSPLVRLLEPRSEAKPYYVQYGWSAAPGAQVKLPDNDTVWTAPSETLGVGHPVTLSWDNGGGLTFELVLSLDDNYMFGVEQRVKNDTGAPVKLYPWARIRRDYTPEVSGYYIMFEGLLGVANGTLQETNYAHAKSEGEKRNGIAFDATSTGGWAGITDKYWLTALIPDQSVPVKAAFRHLTENGSDRYQVDFVTEAAQTAAPNAEATSTTRLFAGA